MIPTPFGRLRCPGTEFPGLVRTSPGLGWARSPRWATATTPARAPKQPVVIPLEPSTW